MRLPVSALLVAAAPASAWEICDELWFTRNLVHDRAGYRFSSALGRAVFDNAGCRPGDVAPTGQAARDVATIRAYEAELGCAVDTTRRALSIPALDQRMALRDIPVPSPWASACHGWRGAGFALRAGRDDAAAVTGSVATGDDILWTFDGADGWSFVLAADPADGMGWFRDAVIPAGSCAATAG